MRKFLFFLIYLSVLFSCVDSEFKSPVRNIMINGAKLTLDAAGEVNLGSNVEVVLGSELEILYP